MKKKNYRKAKKGDVKCRVCKHYRAPYFDFERGRCAVKQGYCVSRNNTCDDAVKENGK